MASIYKRGRLYWIKYYDNGRQVEYSLKTDSLQIAKEHQRRVESAQLRGDDVPRVTRTPTAEIVQRYAEHIRTVKTAKSAQTDIYYLRDTFGPICPALEITSRQVTAKAKKKPAQKSVKQQGGGRQPNRPVLEARHFKQITTAEITAFIDAQVRSARPGAQDRQPLPRNPLPHVQLGRRPRLDPPARCAESRRRGVPLW